MDQKLSFVTVAAADLERLRTFYVSGLGWTPLLDVENEVIFFQIGPGVVLSFYDQRHFAADIGDYDMATTPMGFTFSHNLESSAQVDALVDRLMSAGARVIKAPQAAAFGGYHAHVTDPAGVIWEIAYNPGWRIEPDGRVVLEVVE